jgi:glycerol-3-phosphate acyltransferase PlsY
LLDLLFKVFLAYLLGSFLGSLILGKLRGGVDIRNLGSGNAGGTNALRTQGPAFAVGVMIIDVGKGWVAAAIIPKIALFGPSQFDEWSAIGSAVAAVIGHVYPIWFGFRGGKGAATLLGTVLGLNAIAALPTLIVWLGVLVLTGYVGLATMIATASFPVYAWLVDSESLLVFGLAMTLFVTFTHRSNIARMRRGTEHRSARLWLLKPR